MAYEFQPPAAKTGAPAEGTCLDCHGGSLLNEAGGSVSIGGIPNSYVPTQTYTITVTVRHPTQHRWGFELVPLTTNNMMADRKSTRLNSSHVSISYAVFCLK